MKGKSSQQYITICPLTEVSSSAVLTDFKRQALMNKAQLLPMLLCHTFLFTK